MIPANSHLSTYRADIDGLRAVAVLAVLFFHAGLGFPGGFVGVDVFFVISGYLITGIILKDLDGGRFRIVEFWERRVRRILPALSVVVLASLAAGWFLFLPQEFRGLGKSAVAQALLVSNVHFWRESGYFDQAAESKPLLHTWSLAVEEQFYLLFPLLLIAVHRLSRAWIPRVILALGCLSFALSVYGSHHYRDATFYLPPTRAWELLIGSFLAAVPARGGSSRWLAELLSWGGLAAILGAVFLYDQKTRFPGIAALPPCVGAAALIWANSRVLTSAGRILAARPLVFIGLISYSLYLWHWPVLVFWKYSAIDPVTLSQRVIMVAASVALAVLSWRFVETPFRRRVILKSRARIFAFAGVATAVVLLAGSAIRKFQGFPSRVPPEMLTFVDGSDEDQKFVHYMSKRVGLKEARAGNFIELGGGDGTMPLKLLVWGDSHAAAAIPVLDTLCRQHHIRGVAAVHAGTPPLVGYDSQTDGSADVGRIPFNDAVIDFARKNRIDNVFLIAKWGGYVNLSGPEPIRQALRRTLSGLKGHCVRVHIMRQVPKPSWDVPRVLAISTFRGNDPDGIGIPLERHRADFQRQSPVFDGLSAEFPEVTVLDPTGLFVTQNQMCRVQENGRSLYGDESHLSAPGALLLKPLLEPAFREMGQSTSRSDGSAPAPGK